MWHCTLKQQSPNFATRNQFDGRQFFCGLGSAGWRRGGWEWFWDGSVYYIYCALYFNYYYISSTLDHQVLDPRGQGPVP